MKKCIKARNHALLCVLLVAAVSALFDAGGASAAGSPDATVAPAKGIEPSSVLELRIETGLHSGDITSLDVDGAERFVVTGSTDKTIRVWELGTGRLLRTIRPPIGEGREGMIQAVAISPDGKVVVCAGDVGFTWGGAWAIYVFDRETGALKQRLAGLPQAAAQLTFSRDGEVLAAGLRGKHGIRLYQAAGYQQIGADPDYAGTVTGLAFDDAGNLVTVARDEYLRRYDYKLNLVEKRKMYLDQPSGVAISPDGNSIAISSQNSGTVRQLVREKKGFMDTGGSHGGKVESYGGLVAYARNGELLHTGGFPTSSDSWTSDSKEINTGRIFVRGVIGTEEGFPLPATRYLELELLKVVVSGRPVALRGLKDGGLVYATVGTVGVLRPRMGEVTYLVKKTGMVAALVSQVQVSNKLCCGGPSGSLRLSRDATVLEFADRAGDAQRKLSRWRFALATGTLVEVKEDQAGGGADFQPPRTIARGFHLAEWENGDAPALNEHPLPLLKGERSKAIAITPDAKAVLVGTSQFIRLFDQDGRQRWEIGVEAGVRGINVSGDGTMAVASLEDGTFRWVRLSDGVLLVSLYIQAEPRRWVMWTPSGYFDAGRSGDELIGWHLNQGGDKEALFYPASRFFEQFYRPGLMALIVRKAQTGKELLASLGQTGRINLQAGFGRPPRVAFVAPKQGGRFGQDELEVQVRAEDLGGGVDEIRFFHNGKVSGGDRQGVVAAPPAASPGGLMRTFRVRLADGPNHFRAVAFSRERIEGDSVELVVERTGQPVATTLHVLAVGINEYKNQALNLNYALPDAQGLLQFFDQAGRSLFKEVKRYHLFDREATKPAIVAKLEELSASAPQDVVVLYLAGHGASVGNAWYFVPHEVVAPENDAQLQRGGLSSEEIRTHLARIGARKILVLVDACKSGAALAALGTRGFEDRKALAQLARATGLHVVAASTEDQFASEVEALSHGVFTYTLLEGLKGGADGSPKDGTITVRELMSYVESSLPGVTEQYKRQPQYPVVDSRGMDFPLALVPQAP